MQSDSVTSWHVYMDTDRLFFPHQESPVTPGNSSLPSTNTPTSSSGINHPQHDSGGGNRGNGGANGNSGKPASTTKKPSTTILSTTITPSTTMSSSTSSSNPRQPPGNVNGRDPMVSPSPSLPSTTPTICEYGRHTTRIQLTHLLQDKMAAISQTIFSDAFSWMKRFVFWLQILWSLFLRVQLTITQHWFR